MLVCKPRRGPCNPSAISPAIYLRSNICKQSQLDEKRLSLDLPPLPPTTTRLPKQKKKQKKKIKLTVRPSIKTC